VDRNNRENNTTKFGQPGIVLYKTIYRTNRTQVLETSLNNYLKFWGFNYDAKTILDSLGINKLTEENYEEVLREVSRKGLEKNEKKESKNLQ
jgi:hypothetical protein